MLQKLLGHRPEKRLQQLRELLAAKEEELAELRREISELERQLAAEVAADTAQTVSVPAVEQPRDAAALKN
jgi:uncharacterized protein involved in exopolysaccharide biosynthesis